MMILKKTMTRDNPTNVDKSCAKDQICLNLIHLSVQTTFETEALQGMMTIDDDVELIGVRSWIDETFAKVEIVML